MTDQKDKAQLEIPSVPIGIYRHYKGNYYVVYSKTIDEETLVPLVHYYSLEKKTRWTRTYENFLEMVETPQYHQKVPRFEWTRRALANELLEAFGDSSLIEAITGLAKGIRFLEGVRI